MTAATEVSTESNCVEQLSVEVVSVMLLSCGFIVFGNEQGVKVWTGEFRTGFQNSPKGAT